MSKCQKVTERESIRQVARKSAAPDLPQRQRKASDVSWARAVDRISKNWTRCYCSMYGNGLSPQLCRKEDCALTNLLRKKVNLSLYGDRRHREGVQL